MDFRKHHVKFVDWLHFFLEPLKKLSTTYNIDNVKGFFPHHFSTPPNQNYIGPVPLNDMYGANHMERDTYTKEFKPWYEEVYKKGDWNFKQQNAEYCRTNVEMLSKYVLSIR